jgi:hypothetical protein
MMTAIAHLLLLLPPQDIRISAKRPVYLTATFLHYRASNGESLCEVASSIFSLFVLRCTSALE